MMHTSLVEDTHSYDVVKERMAYVPENYIGSGLVEVGTAPSIDPRQIFQEAKRRQPAPLWRILVENKSFLVRRPILVSIYQDEDLFFAGSDSLAVYGTGDDPVEALQDLSLHIMHFFNYYKKLDKRQLRGDALRLKELYNKLLAEE
ncbi:hypothetical protein E3J38_05275 [candidate division TA06 bacterium]|uniref:Uncharacterized protein n=1 Tax=candidate division TA06 bacterium TaxID=2250710 RepID=A0A523XMU8_UNCT6|nr:MAG: hypothetical protein E3J38_05275 [candidate division TA06 bacterium]